MVIYNFRIKNSMQARFEDEYENLNQIIGQGAFAQVFLARNRKTGEKVAVKMSNSNSAISQKEKMILEQLSRSSHPSVIRIHRIFDQQNVMLIVEEYCSGGTLYEMMVKTQRFPEQEAVEIISQVASGLQFLHQNNIVHRDIKPENVLRQVTEQGVFFKITDFGLSSNKDQRMMTTKVGTAYYVAPEILDGRVIQDGYDRTVDTWALGLMMDELLHGSPFYNGTTEEEVFAKIRNDLYYIRDPIYSEATKSQYKQYIIKQVLFGSVVRDPAKRKDLRQIIQLLEDYKTATQQISAQEQHFQTNIQLQLAQSALPSIPTLQMQHPLMTLSSIPSTQFSLQKNTTPRATHNHQNSYTTHQIDLLDYPEHDELPQPVQQSQQSSVYTCIVHKMPLLFKVPEEDAVGTYCIQCLRKVGILEINEYQNQVKQAIQDFTTKGFEHYYKHNVFASELLAMANKYQDETYMFSIIESDGLHEKYLLVGQRYAKKARSEFNEIVEGIKVGKSGAFISKAMKSYTDSGNSIVQEMFNRMQELRQEAVRECENILRQSLINLINSKLSLE